MTDLVDPVRHAVTPMARLEPVVFAHARIAMLISTTAGIVVEVNLVAAELFGRAPYELVQEPLDRHVAPLSGLPFDTCLRDASISTEARSFGPCTIRRRDVGSLVMELVVSSGCQVSGRNLLLVQLAPLTPDRSAG